MTTETKDTRFKPGSSGNPAGRKPGTGWSAQAREQLQRAWEGEAPDGADGIRAKLIAQAKAGDMLAIKLVAERIVQPLKPADPMAEIELQGTTLAEKALGVLTALATGALPLAQAKEMLAGLATLTKVIEAEELKGRIEALEKLLQERAHGTV